MTDAATPNQPPDATQAAPATTPVARIEHKLDQLDQRLQTIERQTAPKDNPAHDPKASRITVALAFALAGFKLGAFLCGKVGLLLIDHPRAFKRAGFEGIKDLWVTVFTLGKDKTLAQTTDTLKYTLISSAGGSILGPIAGAWIGFVRGDRLDKPSDLFAHPIESMKKILGPAPAKHPPTPMPASTTPKNTPTQPSAGTITHEGSLKEAHGITR